MSLRREVSASDLARDPRSLWRAFVDLLVRERLERMSELQRRAHLAFVYDAEVIKGGHTRFFESDAALYTRETIRALDRIDLWPQARILERALALTEATGRQPSRWMALLARSVLGDELSEVDEQYRRCSPTITQTLERLLAEHQDEFIVLRER